MDKDSEVHDHDTSSIADAEYTNVSCCNAKEGGENQEQQDPLFVLTVSHHGQTHPIEIWDPTATLADFSSLIEHELRIPLQNQKLMITPKVGLLKHPFKDPGMLASTLVDKRIVVMGATSDEIADLQAGDAVRRQREARRLATLQAGRSVQANKTRDWKKVQDEATYTFHTIKPLMYLPNPEKSKRFLERLAADAGIKASMRKHGFSVGLLTEMNPVEHTTDTSRTLGLNRNRGEVIELRLRTDAYDGYRDYKVIRKTLCHELTHNVWGDHDGRFWKLCKEIEKEVEQNDWRRGGHSVAGEEFYNPGDEGVDEEADGGGWTGGDYVLGGGDGSAASGLSRREIMARAAEKRMTKEKNVGKADEQDRTPEAR